MRRTMGALVAMLACATVASAIEPAGHVAVTTTWLDDGRERLAVEVVPLVAIAGLDARVVVPPGWTVDHGGDSLRSGPVPSRRAVSLGPLSIRRAAARSADDGAVLEIAITGTDERGRGFTERVGVVVGTPDRGIPHRGAREFTARAASAPARRAPGARAAAVLGRAAGWTATGTALYRDRVFGPPGFTGDEPLLPIREADVEVRDAATGALLGQAATGADGAFAVAVADQSTRDVVVRVLTRSDATTDLHLTVTDEADEPYALAAATAPAHPPTVALDVGLLVAEIGQGGEPFNVWDSALDGLDYLGSLLGQRPGSSDLLNLVWEADRGQGASTASFYRVDVRDTGAYDDTVVLHETGHWTVLRWSESDNPGGSHGFSQCDQVAELAWDEGHATYFAAAVRRHAGRPWPHVYVSTSGAPGPGHVSLYADLETETEYSCRGATGEVAVFTALWDVIDDADVADVTPGVDDDPLAVADAEYWENLTEGFPRHRRLTTEDWWDAWFEPPVLNGELTGMQAVFGAVGIEYFEDAFETNDDEETAATVVVGSAPAHATFFSDPEQDGSGDEIRETDWFLFPAYAGGTYRLETTNLWSAADTALRLVGPTGGTLASNDDREPGDASSLIEWSPAASGVHRIEVEQPRDWTWYGSYDLVVTVTPDADGDGVPDPADCAALGATTSIPPVEVGGLGWSGSTLTWERATEARVYDVYRARLAASVPWSDLAICDAGGLLERTHVTADPPPGTLDAYVVAGRNGCGAGPFGAAGGGAREPAVPCAADPVADADGDAIPDVDDTCPAVANPGQADGDGDRVGDACDVCPSHYDPTQTDAC